MINPRPYFPAILAAYSLPGALAGVSLVDTILGMDLDGERPYGAVIGLPDGSQVIGFAGTRTGPEWVEDFEAEQVQTPLGGVSYGIWCTYSTLRTASGVPLATYAKAKVGGHSRGGPLAALWAVEYGSPEWCVFNSPRLLASDVLSKLACIAGAQQQVIGDLVSLLASFYPGFPFVNKVDAPGLGDLVYHHSFSTCMAACCPGPTVQTVVSSLPPSP